MISKIELRKKFPTMLDDDFEDMFNRMNRKIRPVGRNFSNCGTKSTRE